MPKGYILGNIAEDLGIDVKRLKSGRARVIAGDSSRYVELNTDKGILSVNERIDRELLCKQISPCSFSFEVILENPIELYRISVEIMDINDHTPTFPKDEINIEISENSLPGARYLLDSAFDPDVGVNAIQTYSLRPMDNFVLKQESHTDVIGHVRYSVPEEMTKGSFVGNIAQDLGLDTKRMISGKARIFAGDNNAGGTGTLQHVYNYEVCMTTDSRKSDIKYLRPISQSLVSVDVSGTETMPHAHKERNLMERADSPEESSYQAFILENNSPGQSVLALKARDADWNQNARVSYILEEGTVNGVPVSSYVSVNSESGVIHAVRSFDYEQIKDFHFRVKAQDGGSPPLSSNVTVKISIQDQNDNAPQILYPVQTGVSLVAEMVPRSADVGYLVTKVVAVDVDSGQNAWLSYKLMKATDRALFEVGLQNGEIRTLRQVTDKDAVKQRLTVVVEDNGQPSRSATVNVNVAVADSFPEVLSEFTDFTHDKDYNDNLTFYLVLALAVVSFLFVASLVVIISVKVYRWRQSRNFYQSNLPVIPYYPPRYADAGGTGTLQHVYNYEVCMTTDSRKSDCKFLRPCSQSVLMVDPSSTDTMQRAQKEKSILDETDSADEVRLW
ncbi:hypothetical protein AAFF_G00200580 [Aldrovandia affinis]|uniref:Cadherin domain-containing protein n=1 Tax=Aldrovandia affinis TaxID=143900 RepID=A0AAD7RKW8_9TELE|nr:hypothetical protein AAFF_G00200580 [Aldrovandia affinis]